MKSLKVEAEFCGEVSIITFRDKDGNVVYQSEQTGECVQNTFTRNQHTALMRDCAESLLKTANVILGEKE